MADWEDIGAAEGWEEISPKKKGKSPAEIVLEGLRPGVAESISSLRGLGESAAHLLTGAIGGGLGTLFGTVAGLRQEGFGEKGLPGVEKEAARQAEQLTFAPRTEKGKEYAGKAGEIISNVLIPLAPVAPLLEGVGAATKTARQLKKAGKPAAPPPGGFAPDVPLTLEEALAQADQLPENQLAGPRRVAPDAGWEDITPPASKRAKLQMELPLEEGPVMSVSGRGVATPMSAEAARVRPPEVALEAQRRAEAVPTRPLEGQGDLFLTDEVTGPIATPFDAAARGALPDVPTADPRLARRQMELQLEEQSPIYVSKGQEVSKSYLNLGQRYPVTLGNKTQITLERVAESPERVVGGPGWKYNPDEVNQTIIARDADGNQIGRLDFHPDSQAIESWVEPGYRRQGIATLLYDAAETHGAVFRGTGEHLGTVSKEAQAVRRARNERGPVENTATAYLELPESTRTITETPEQIAFAQAEAERRMRADQTKQAIEAGETGNLFADYVNQHRDYELFRDENGRPLSRTAFNETVDNLAKEPSTGYVRPENMDEAYSKYLANFEGVQAGLFDQPTTALEMAQTLKNDATARLVARHPLVKAAERFLNQEQQFLDQLKQQGATAAAIADAARDVAKAAARLEKTTTNVEAGIKGGTKPAALRKQPKEIVGEGGKVTYMYEGIGETIRRVGKLSNILGSALDNQFNPDALRNRNIDITPGEAKAKYLPQGVQKGLADYTMERRPAAEIAAEAIEKNIPDIPNTPVQDRVMSGALPKQLATNNPIVRKTHAAMKDAAHAATANIREFIQDKKKGIPALFRQLSKKEVGDWWAARQVAEGDVALTPEMMREMGMNEKQIALNTRLNEALDFAFERYNAARALMGKGPIDRRVGYLAGQMSGDFRVAIYDKATKEYVGAVGSDIRGQAVGRVKKLLDANPQWEAGPIKAANRQKRDSRQKAFEDAVEMMMDENPNVKALMDAYDKILKDDAYNYMNAKKHSLQKKGTFGTEGFKRDVDAWTNAKEGMQSQIRYLEKIMNWAEVSKAVDEVRPLLTNDQLNMPNAKAWASDYIDRALGIQTSSVGHALDSVIEAVGGKFGVGPSAIERGVGAAKGAVSKMLLGFFQPMYLAINTLQPGMAAPVANSFLRSRGLEGAHMGMLPKNIISFLKMNAEGKLGELTAFEKAIKKEGEKRNIFGSEFFDHSVHLRKAGYAANKLSEIGIPQVEGATRGFIYTHFANVLERNGYKGRELFDIAENLTNEYMIDYHQFEAPAMYKEMGAVGDMAVTLQRYKHGQLSMLTHLVREASRNKSYRPIATAIGTGLAFSGLTGMLGFNEADFAYQQVTKAMGKPDTLTRLAMDHLPDTANFGAISTLTGIDMSKRFGMTLFPDSPSGALFPGASKLYDIGEAAVGAAMSPTNVTQRERLMREAAPGILKGPAEREFFEDEEGMAFNPRTLEPTVRRTAEDKFAKSVGGTGLHESKVKARLYQESLIDKQFSAKRQKITNRLTDDLYQMRGNPDQIAEYFTSGKGAELRDKFVEAEGNIDNLINTVVKFQEKSNLTAKQRAALATAAAAESGKEGDSLRAKRYAEMLKKLED